MARILVADDESPIRSLIAGCLRIEGHDVTAVGSGDDVLAKLEGEIFDLLVIDLVMPGISGYETIEKIRWMPKVSNIPVIMLSNEGDPYNLVRESELNVTDHVQKPVGFHELEDSVNRVLAGSTEELDDLRVVRDDAVQAYRRTISLIDDVRAHT